MSTQSSFAEAAIAALNVSAVASYPPHVRRWAEADAMLWPELRFS